MIYKQKLITLMTIFSLMSVGWGCIDSVEVELWGQCYNINTTTMISSNINDTLTGEIPEQICELVNLYYLDLGENDLNGGIPECIGNLINLNVLKLFNNELFGEIPSSICNLNIIEEIHLGGNNLTGQIPDCIFDLPLLVSLSLPVNELSGNIPNNIGNLSNLVYLSLRDNQLSGYIPNSICDLMINFEENNNIFQGFTIQNNNLCEPYPVCVESFVGNQECISGDFNGDNNVNILDVIIMINCILLNSNCNNNFDLNFDEVINIMDIIVLINIILNTTTPLPLNP